MAASSARGWIVTHAFLFSRDDLANRVDCGCDTVLGRFGSKCDWKHYHCGAGLHLSPTTSNAPGSRTCNQPFQTSPTTALWRSRLRLPVRPRSRECCAPPCGPCTGTSSRHPPKKGFDTRSSCCHTCSALLGSQPFSLMCQRIQAS